MTIKERIEEAKRAELLTVQQVSLLLNFHPITIYRKVARREIPGVVRYGRTLRFRSAITIPWGESLRRPARPFRE